MTSGYKALLWALRGLLNCHASPWLSKHFPSCPGPVSGPSHIPDHLTQTEVLREVRCPLLGGLGVLSVRILFGLSLSGSATPSTVSQCPRGCPPNLACPWSFSFLQGCPDAILPDSSGFMIGFTCTAGCSVFIRQHSNPDVSCEGPDCIWNFRPYAGQDRSTINRTGVAHKAEDLLRLKFIPVARLLTPNSVDGSSSSVLRAQQNRPNPCP